MVDIEEFYPAYFEQLAQLHPDINHDPEGQCHFWELTDIDNLSDLNKALGNKLSLPALILRPFSDETSYHNDNPVQVLSGTITVLVKITKDDWGSIRLARRNARKMALQLIARMRKDAMPKGELAKRSIHLERNFPGSDEPVVAGTTTGWSYEFDWRLPVNLMAPDWSRPSTD